MGVELIVGQTNQEVIEVHPTVPSPPGPVGPQGEKGDPGGWVASSIIATGVDLNTLTTPGTYFRGTASGSTTALNYPLDSWAGWIEVIGGGTLMQRATATHSGSVLGNWGNNVWWRTRYGGTWQQWRRLDIAGHEAAADPHSQYALNTNVYRTGTGFPEGVVTAPVGTRYIDTAATNGAIEWIKATGAGNTGWQVVYGDTGTRAFAPLSENGYTGGSVRLRRIGNTCYLTGLSVTRASTVGEYRVVIDMPLGMRPVAPAYFRTLIGTAYGFVTNVVTIAYAGLNENFTMTWMTADAWPTTLPGTAV